MRPPFPPPFADGPTGDAGTERLTVGAATVVLAPVDDAVHLSALVGPVRRIPGIVGVDVRAFEDGEAVVAVRAGHPVLLASELRRVLAGLVRSCTAAAAGGRVVVDARAPLPPPPPVHEEAVADGDAPTGDAGDEVLPEDEPPADRHDRSMPPRARRGTGAASGDHRHGPAPGDGAGDAGRGSRARAQDAPSDPAAGAPSAGDDGPPPPRGPLGPDAVAAALAGAIDDATGLSVLVFDGERRIRAVAGEVPGDGAVLVGRSIADAFAPEAHRLVLPAIAGALQGRTRTVGLPDDDGGAGLEVRCRPVGGGHPGGICVVRDLDAQGDTGLLAEATGAFEITFRHSPIGQGLLSRSGRWLRVNGALGELVGRTADDLVGAEMAEALHPDDRDGERARLRRLVDGADDHYVVAARFLHADGRAVRTHTRMTRITDERGTVRGFVAQVVDAAAWKRFSRR